METKFDAPQLIQKGTSTYGLEKQEEMQISYVQLEKDSEGKYKRTETKWETHSTQLAKEIKDGSVQVVMPSRSYVNEAKRREFHNQFKAPAMIAKDQRTYGFEKESGLLLSYIELKKDGATWKRTDHKTVTDVTTLANEIKKGVVKVVMPHREYIAEKNRAPHQKEVGNPPSGSDRKKENETSKKAATEIKPVEVEPLNSRERREVKEAMQQGKLEDNKHATQLFHQFERQLQSVPDTVQGQKLTNADKLKLLVGDYSDHQNTRSGVTRYSVQLDKTVRMEGNGNGLLTTANSQFSEKQVERQRQQAKLETGKSLAY